MTGYALGMKDENGYQYPLRAITSPALVRTAIVSAFGCFLCVLFPAFLISSRKTSTRVDD